MTSRVKVGSTSPPPHDEGGSTLPPPEKVGRTPAIYLEEELVRAEALARDLAGLTFPVAGSPQHVTEIVETNGQDPAKIMRRKR